MELSAGVGGQESMLFCNELLGMYCGYCDLQGWDYTITSCDTSDLEGVRHAAVSIDHPGMII
jgi:protein subunit release factor A